MNLLNPKAKEFPWIRDLVTLNELSHESILGTIASGYANDQIYTNVGPVLVSVNPFKSITALDDASRVRSKKKKRLFSSLTSRIFLCAATQQYKVAPMRLNSLPPHVFTIAQQAYTQLRQSHRSQSVLVSGESGAGKTEVGKAVIGYIASLSGNESVIEKRIIEANPLLEAFGNARTIRNRNSSRFGKFTKVFFDGTTITGAAVEHYLLEKSRIVHQETGDRNYHIFYYLLAGADDALRTELSLGEPLSTYAYLGAPIENTDDEQLSVLRSKFNSVKKAFELFAFTAEEQRNVWSTIAAVLHIGELKFEFSKELKRMQPIEKPLLARVAQLLGMTHPMLLEVVLTTRKMTSGGRNSTYSISNTEAEVYGFRDALAKALYEQLFAYLLGKVNSVLNEGGVDTTAATSRPFIAVLDIFGFEMFEHNSFEQLCINFANEKLHQQFLESIFKAEQSAYAAEGVPFSSIDFVDNAECVELIEKPLGVFALLDEECRLPKGTDVTLVEKLERSFEKHPNFAMPKRSRAAGSATGAKVVGFTINHYAYPVFYETDGFLEKNRDKLYADIEGALQCSKSTFIRTLFGGTPVTPPNLAEQQAKPDERAASMRGSRPTLSRQSSQGDMNSKKVVTLSSRFKVQLAALRSTITATDVSYVRCVKPNEQLVPDLFDNDFVARQLHYCGLMETIRVRQLGYALRLKFDEFVDRYSVLLTGTKSGDLKAVSARILSEAGVSNTNYAVGKTRMFLKQAVVGQLDGALSERLNALALQLTSTSRALLDRADYAVRQQKHHAAVVQKRTTLATLIATSFRACKARRDYEARMKVAREAELARREAERLRLEQEEYERRAAEENARREAEERERREHAEQERREKAERERVAREQREADERRQQEEELAQAEMAEQAQREHDETLQRERAALLQAQYAQEEADNAADNNNNNLNDNDIDDFSALESVANLLGADVLADMNDLDNSIINSGGGGAPALPPPPAAFPAPMMGTVIIKPNKKPPVPGAAPSPAPIGDAVSPRRPIVVTSRYDGAPPLPPPVSGNQLAPPLPLATASIPPPPIAGGESAPSLPRATSSIPPPPTVGGGAKLPPPSGSRPPPPGDKPNRPPPPPSASDESKPNRPAPSATKLPPPATALGLPPPVRGASDVAAPTPPAVDVPAVTPRQNSKAQLDTRQRSSSVSQSRPPAMVESPYASTGAALAQAIDHARRGSGDANAGAGARRTSRGDAAILSTFRNRQMALCLYDYEGQMMNQSDALLFHKWNVIEVTDKLSYDWWSGKRGTEQQGLFPSSYVELLPSPINVVVGEYDFASTTEGHLNFQKGDLVVIVEQKDDWMWGYTGGIYGRFPATYVHDSTSSNSGSTAGTSSSGSLPGAPGSVPLPPAPLLSSSNYGPTRSLSIDEYGRSSGTSMDLRSAIEAARMEANSNVEQHAAAAMDLQLPGVEDPSSSLMQQLQTKLIRAHQPGEHLVSVIRGKDLTSPPTDGLMMYLFDDVLFLARRNPFHSAATAHEKAPFDSVTYVMLEKARMIELALSTTSHMIGFQLEVAGRSLYTFLFDSHPQKIAWMTDCKLAVRRWQVAAMQELEGESVRSKTATSKRSFWGKTKGLLGGKKNDPASGGGAISAADVRAAMLSGDNVVIPTACTLFVDGLSVAWHDIMSALGATSTADAEAHLRAFGQVHVGCIRIGARAGGRDSVEGTFRRLRSNTLQSAPSARF